MLDGFMKSPNQQEVWEGVALKWAEFRTRPVEEAKEFLKGKKGKVLDLGCGSGRKFIKGNVEFYGIDFSKKLLKIAKEKDYVELKKGTVDNIPYRMGFLIGLFLLGFCTVWKGRRSG
tara:strand:+ start:480 stop:830 length:351 start_codon:yes stop_codon:yes gene_type:complete